MRQQLEKADRVAWDSFSDNVDRHFERDSWETEPVPSQVYPSEVAQILNILDRDQPRGWLRVDSTIRDFDSEGRDKLAVTLRDLASSLKETRVRRFLFGNTQPIQIWLTCEQAKPTVAEMQREGEIACLAANVSRVSVLRLQCDMNGTILRSTCRQVATPPIIRNDHAALVAEAARQRARYLAAFKGKKLKKSR
jgi:hypothetical protein